MLLSVAIAGGIFVLAGIAVGGYLAYSALTSHAKAPTPTRPVAVTPRPTEKEPPVEQPPPPGGGLSPEVLRKVKRATVRLRVSFGDDEVATGSGFFAVEPGVILTNAHVIGMLASDSPAPERIEVVLNSGESEERTFPGSVVSVDRDSDLAVLRIPSSTAGYNASLLPAPLPVASATALQETQAVYVVGFPFGEQLGKNITVSQTSVSSLRKNAFGALTEIQVNGGMHPGNSGGPVVDGRGQVVGVAVAVVLNTTINFAIPGDAVHTLLAGRVAGMTTREPYRKGDKVLLPIRVQVADPLRRARKASLDVWTGSLGQTRPAARLAPAPGDSPRQTIPLDHRLDLAWGDVALPALPGGQVYWLQPMLTTATGAEIWGHAQPILPPIPAEPRSLTLAYRPRPESKASLDLNTQAILRFSNYEGKELPYATWMRTSVVESAAVEDSDTRLSIRFPEKRADGRRRLDAGADLGDKIWAGKDKLEQANRELDKVRMELAVAEGKRRWKNTELGETSSSSRETVKEIVERVKNGLDVLTVPLPGGELTPGKAWQASQPLLLILPPITSENVTLDLTYTYRGARTRGGRTEALVAVSGVLRELETRTLHLTGDVEGTASLDPATGEVVLARLTVAMNLQVTLRSGTVRSSGSFEVQMRRRDAEKETDPDGLWGKWVVTAGKFEGKDTAGGQQWHFHPDGVEVLGNRTETWDYRADLTRTPGRIDLNIPGEPVRPGIFLIAGDRLMICYQALDRKRPEAFASTADSGLRLLFLERMK